MNGPIILGSSFCIAVASGWAGQVLARPLFCRLNVHMCYSNTREVMCISISKPSGKMAAHHCANFTGEKKHIT